MAALDEPLRHRGPAWRPGSRLVGVLQAGGQTPGWRPGSRPEARLQAGGRAPGRRPGSRPEGVLQAGGRAPGRRPGSRLEGVLQEGLLTSVSSSILAPSACSSASRVSRDVFPEVWSEDKEESSHVNVVLEIPIPASEKSLILPKMYRVLESTQVYAPI